jgi:hypothetical protein
MRIGSSERLRRTAAAVVAVLAFAGAALAHHGWSSYDEKKVLNVTGVIREAGYDNPHGFVKLEADGKVWHVVLAPPSRMQARGLAAEMLASGTTVTVVGYPHRRNAGEMRAERITVGEKTVELR